MHYFSAPMASPAEPFRAEREFDPRRSAHQAIAVVVVFWLLHTIASWGYTGVFWGTQGRWLHEVERFARGETPYRDFQWHFPPLAMWLVGGIAKITGTSLAAISTTTAALALAALIAYYRFVVRLATAVAVPAVVAGTLFAFVYANAAGVPLPLGTISPAGPLGVMLILLAVSRASDLLRTPARPTGAMLGILAGLAVLSKHTFWLPALYLVGFCAVRLGQDPRRPRGVRRALVTAFAATTVTGFGGVLAQGGFGALAGLLVGFGGGGDVLRHGLPSLERVTIEVAATAALVLVGVASLWLSFAMADARAGRLVGLALLVFLSACAVHLGMSFGTIRRLAAEGLSAMPTPTEDGLWPAVASGRSSLRAALGALDERFQQHLFPSILSPLLLITLVVLWRRWAEVELRDRALLLLGLCIALRVRRGMGGTEWYHPLIEIPTYAVFLRLVAGTAVRHAQRTASAAVAILLAVGMYCYYNQGRGPLTRRVFSATSTAAGRVRWPADEAADFRAVRRTLDSLDPTGLRPVLAFGQTGGWSYFLARRNVSRITEGFYFTDGGGPREAMALRVHDPAPLLIDNRLLSQWMVVPRFTPLAWEPPMRPTRHAREDRALFETMAQGCTVVPLTPSDRPRFVVYDCPLMPRDSSR